MHVEKVIQRKTVIVSPEHTYLLESGNWNWDKHSHVKRIIYVKDHLSPETEYMRSLIRQPQQGDHIDRNKANNTKENLRNILPWQIMVNIEPRRTELGLKGATQHTNEYRA